MQMKNKFLLLGLCIVASVLCIQRVGLAQEIAVKDTTSESNPVDFPGRISLSEEKEAPLPSLSESVIKEPAPMERVVSKKEAPSEQLLGRITPEVFHEMADLERGNVFLELQSQREELKNKVEDLKSKYREARLAEIEKRENVIRSRVKWQQEQERIRQEILEQQLKTELLEKQLEETEVAKEDLLPVSEMTEDEEEEEENLQDKKAKKESVAEETEDDEEDDEEEEEEKKVEKKKPVKIYRIEKIIDIKGMKGRLVARAVDNNGKTVNLKVGSVLPSGYVVKDITKTEIILTKDDVVDIVDINQLSNPVDDADEMMDEE